MFLRLLRPFVAGLFLVDPVCDSIEKNPLRCSAPGRKSEVWRTEALHFPAGLSIQPLMISTRRHLHQWLRRPPPRKSSHSESFFDAPPIGTDLIGREIAIFRRSLDQLPHASGVMSREQNSWHWLRQVGELKVVYQEVPNSGWEFEVWKGDRTLYRLAWEHGNAQMLMHVGGIEKSWTFEASAGLLIQAEWNEPPRISFRLQSSALSRLRELMEESGTPFQYPRLSGMEVLLIPSSIEEHLRLLHWSVWAAAGIGLSSALAAYGALAFGPPMHWPSQVELTRLWPMLIPVAGVALGSVGSNDKLPFSDRALHILMREIRKIIASPEVWKLKWQWLLQQSNVEKPPHNLTVASLDFREIALSLILSRMHPNRVVRHRALEALIDMLRQNGGHAVGYPNKPTRTAMEFLVKESLDRLVVPLGNYHPHVIDAYYCLWTNYPPIDASDPNSPERTRLGQETLSTLVRIGMPRGLSPFIARGLDHLPVILNKHQVDLDAGNKAFIESLRPRAAAGPASRDHVPAPMSPEEVAWGERTNAIYDFLVKAVGREKVDSMRWTLGEIAGLPELPILNLIKEISRLVGDSQDQKPAFNLLAQLLEEFNPGARTLLPSEHRKILPVQAPPLRFEPRLVRKAA